MLKEALDFVFTKARELTEARTAREIECLSDERTVVYEHAGRVMERPVPPPLRKHSVTSIGDLCAAANRWGTKGAIWISQNDITLITDDADRREHVNLQLHYTDVFAQAMTLAQTPKIEQATLVRLLRREFRASPQATTILSAVRKIKFRRGETGHSDLQHGNESLGREVEAEVTGAGDIPDSLTLPVCVYANPGERDNVVTIAFDLEIDVHQQKFILKPMPDEISIAINMALEAMKKAIVAGGPKDIPVLYGTP